LTIINNRSVNDNEFIRGSQIENVLLKMVDIVRERLEPLIDNTAFNMNDITKRFEAIENRFKENNIEIILENKCEDLIKNGMEGIKDDTIIDVENSFLFQKINEEVVGENIIKVCNENKIGMVVLCCLPRFMVEKLERERSRRLRHLKLYNDTNPCDIIERIAEQVLKSSMKIIFNEVHVICNDMCVNVMQDEFF
jgi:hypothetical protein